MGFVSFTYLNSEDNFILVRNIATRLKETPTSHTNTESSVQGIKCRKHRISENIEYRKYEHSIFLKTSKTESIGIDVARVSNFWMISSIEPVLQSSSQENPRCEFEQQCSLIHENSLFMLP